MLAVEHVQRLAPKRQLARDHLEKNDAKGVDVGTTIHRSGIAGDGAHLTIRDFEEGDDDTLNRLRLILLEELLGRHVGAGAKPGA